MGQRVLKINGRPMTQDETFSYIDRLRNQNTWFLAGFSIAGCCCLVAVIGFIVMYRDCRDSMARSKNSAADCLQFIELLDASRKENEQLKAQVWKTAQRF